jgi:hypothetical protein
MRDFEEGTRVSRLVAGGILILVGLLLVLSNAGAIRPLRLGDFGPMLLIWAGASRLLAPTRSGPRVSGAIVLALGIFFQLDRLGWIGLSFREVWPFLLVVAGAAMILEGLRARRAIPAGSTHASGPTAAPSAGPGGPQ